MSLTLGPRGLDHPWNVITWQPQRAVALQSHVIKSSRTTTVVLLQIPSICKMYANHWMLLLCCQYRNSWNQICWPSVFCFCANIYIPITSSWAQHVTCDAGRVCCNIHHWLDTGVPCSTKSLLYHIDLWSLAILWQIYINGRNMSLTWLWLVPPYNSMNKKSFSVRRETWYAKDAQKRTGQ